MNENRSKRKRRVHHTTNIVWCHTNDVPKYQNYGAVIPNAITKLISCSLNDLSVGKINANFNRKIRICVSFFKKKKTTHKYSVLYMRNKKKKKMFLYAYSWHKRAKEMSYIPFLKSTQAWSEAMKCVGDKKIRRRNKQIYHKHKHNNKDWNPMRDFSWQNMRSTERHFFASCDSSIEFHNIWQYTHKCLVTLPAKKFTHTFKQAFSHASGLMSNKG